MCFGSKVEALLSLESRRFDGTKSTSIVGIP